MRGTPAGSVSTSAPSSRPSGRADSRPGGGLPQKMADAPCDPDGLRRTTHMKAAFAGNGPGHRDGKEGGRMDDPLERFASLYDQFYRNVLRYALQHAEQDSAEDVASDVFLVAWRRLADIPEPPLPWLLGVARNLLRKQAAAAAHESDRCAHQRGGSGRVGCRGTCGGAGGGPRGARVPA